MTIAEHSVNNPLISNEESDQRTKVILISSGVIASVFFLACLVCCLCNLLLKIRRAGLNTSKALEHFVHVYRCNQSHLQFGQAPYASRPSTITANVSRQSPAITYPRSLPTSNLTRDNTISIFSSSLFVPMYDYAPSNSGITTEEMEFSVDDPPPPSYQTVIKPISDALAADIPPPSYETAVKNLHL